MIIITYIILFNLLVTLPLLYITYILFLGKPLLLNAFPPSIILLIYFIWNPYRFYMYLQLNPIYDLSLIDPELSLPYYLSPLIFQFVASLILFPLFYIFFKNRYYFLNINTKKYAKIIVEEAIQRLEIPFESLEKATKIGDKSIYYFTEGLCKWKYIYLDVHEIKDTVLRKSIIKEIRDKLFSYKKPTGKIIAIALLIIVGALINSIRPLLTLLQ